MTPKKIDLLKEERVHKEVSVLDKGSLIRRLGALDLYAIGYGDVGSSIYYALGVTTIFALGAAPVAFLIAGVFFVLTALTYAELGSSIPEAGGSGTFARYAYNDFMSFVAGWALMLDYVVTIAISAYTVGPYLKYFWPALGTGGAVPFALFVIAVLVVLNIVGIRGSTRVSIALCGFGLVTQLILIVVGLIFLFNGPVILEGIKRGFVEGDFIKGMAMAMVAFIGIESVVQLAGEVKDPAKSVPKAVFAVMGTLLVVYLGISLVAFSALSPHELSTTYVENPLAGIATALGNVVPQFSWLAAWVGLLGAAILFIAANAGIIGASRLTFAMGEHFQLPRFFYALHPVFKTPYISILLFGAIAALIIVVIGRNSEHALRGMAELYSFGAMLSFAIDHSTLITLRIKKPDLPRPYRIGWNVQVKGKAIPITAIIGFLATCAVWLVVVFTKPVGRVVGFSWMGIGILLYFIYRHKQKVPLMERVVIEKVQVPGFHHTTAKHLLVPIKGGGEMLELQTASKIAKEDGAAMTVLYVIEIPEHLPLDTFFPKQYWEGETVLDHAEAVAGEWSLPVDKKIVQGRSAGESIVDVAQELNIDVIVMGTKPKLALRERLWYSTTVDFVSRNAPCRVMTVG